MDKNDTDEWPSLNQLGFDIEETVEQKELTGSNKDKTFQVVEEYSEMPLFSSSMEEADASHVDIDED